MKKAWHPPRMPGKLLPSQRRNRPKPEPYLANAERRVARAGELNDEQHGDSQNSRVDWMQPSNRGSPAIPSLKKDVVGVTLGSSIPFSPVRDMTENVGAIAATDNHTCVVKGGAVYCWGSNETGQLGLDDGSFEPMLGLQLFRPARERYDRG
jgi:hypothetical protein